MASIGYFISFVLLVLWLACYSIGSAKECSFTYLAFPETPTIITSPNYTFSNAPLTKCSSVIVIPSQYRLISYVLDIEWLDFHLDSAMPRCDENFVEIYIGDGSLGKFCGSVEPNRMNSFMKDVTFALTTDGISSNQGFRLKFSLKPNYSNSSWRQDILCNFSGNATSGLVFPGYWKYQGYTKDNCTYTLSVRPGRSMVITIMTMIDLRSSSSSSEAIYLRDDFFFQGYKAGSVKQNYSYGFQDTFPKRIEVPYDTIFINPDYLRIGNYYYYIGYVAFIGKPTLATSATALSYGINAELNCTLRGDSPFSPCQWFKNNVILQGHSSCSMNLSSTWAAAGTYYCRIKDGDEKSEHSNVQQITYEFPQDPYVTLSTTVTDAVAETRSVSVECTLFNATRPIAYNWMLENKNISSVSTLHFSSVKLTDAGTYTCVATGKKVQIAAPFRLLVLKEIGLSFNISIRVLWYISGGLMLNESALLKEFQNERDKTLLNNFTKAMELEMDYLLANNSFLSPYYISSGVFNIRYETLIVDVIVQLDERAKNLTFANLNESLLNDFKNTSGRLNTTSRDTIGIDENHLIVTDFNECTSPRTNACHWNATCIDTEWTYLCKCKKGFKGNGRSCEREDVLNKAYVFVIGAFVLSALVILVIIVLIARWCKHVPKKEMECEGIQPGLPIDILKPRLR